MNKITFLRNSWAEKYQEKDLVSAAEIGEVLLREHWHNNNMWTQGYADDLFNLACVHEELGNLQRAAELFSDSVRQLSAIEGESLTFAERINNLAAVLIRLGLAEPAFFMLGNATAIRRRELGENNLIYADSLYNLGNAAADIGLRKDSIHYHTEALKIRQNEGNTPDIINSLHSIAFLYESASDYEKAVSYAETALKHSADNEHDFARACNYLAGLYENCKAYKAALPLYEMILDITEVKAGIEHSSYLNTAIRRANLLTLMEKPHEALAAYEEICEIFIASGTKNTSYANCLRGMAVIYKSLNNPEQAEKFILEAMKIRRKMYEDITLDISFLIHLHLHEKDEEKTLNALVYALMCTGKNSPGFNEILETIGSLFANENSADIKNFTNAVKLLLNENKIRPILSKWADWEMS